MPLPEPALTTTVGAYADRYVDVYGYELEPPLTVPDEPPLEA